MHAQLGLIIIIIWNLSLSMENGNYKDKTQIRCNVDLKSNEKKNKATFTNHVSAIIPELWVLNLFQIYSSFIIQEIHVY